MFIANHKDFSQGIGALRATANSCVNKPLGPTSKITFVF